MSRAAWFFLLITLFATACFVGLAGAPVAYLCWLGEHRLPGAASAWLGQQPYCLQDDMAAWQLWFPLQMLTAGCASTLLCWFGRHMQGPWLPVAHGKRIAVLSLLAAAAAAAYFDALYFFWLAAKS